MSSTLVNQTARTSETRFSLAALRCRKGRVKRLGARLERGHVQSHKPRVFGHSLEETREDRYPLVNVYITMENHHFFFGKSTISMAMFNGYVNLPKGTFLGTQT